MDSHYYDCNKLSLEHIKHWLISVGAIAGQKSSKFKADWSKAAKFANLISWYRKNRGFSRNHMYGREFENYTGDQFNALLRILADYNDHTDGPDSLFSEWNSEIRGVIKSREIDTRIRAFWRGKHEHNQRIAYAAAPGLQQQLEEIRNKRKALEEEYAEWQRQCIATHNTGMMNSIMREYRNLP